VKSNDVNNSVCFNNRYVQFMHKYSSVLFMIILGMMGYWLTGLEKKADAGVETRHIMLVKQATMEAQQAQITVLLQGIDKKLDDLDKRVYSIVTNPNKDRGY